MSSTPPRVIPHILTESLTRHSGMIFYGGPAGSGVDQTLQQGLQSLKGRRVETVGSLSSLEEGATAQVIHYRMGLRDLPLERLVRLAESGILVICEMSSTDCLTSLRQIYSLNFGEGRPHILWRLSQQLILVGAQMRVKSLQGNDEIDLFEMLLMTPQLKEALRAEDLSFVEGVLQHGEEESGALSFNQSLLQHLLRRHIDMKTAFVSTRDPVHLDQLLKKVGI